MKLLESVLRLEPERLEGLAARWHIPIDLKKRITVGEQVARGLVLVPRWLDAAALNDGQREAVRLLAVAPRGLLESGLPTRLEELIEDGFLYRDPARSERVYMPAAFRLQVSSSPSDSPRSARLLLRQVGEEARRELCQHHLKRVPPLPWPMLLETVLERLEDQEWVRAEVASLDQAERTLLRAVDALGGEVNGEEVLELSREPVRISHGGVVRVPRRSAIFSLARRGLVLTRSHGWVIPDEVERVTGRERRGRAGIERQRLLMSRHIQDLTPSRAQLAEPAGLLAVGLMAALAASDELPSEGKGLSKQAVRRAALHLRCEAERAEFLLCLARAEGLFSSQLPVRSVSEALVACWRRGGAWDEAAVEPDMFRPGHPSIGRSNRATHQVREALLDTLLLLPPGEFALKSDVEAAACTDLRVIAAQRMLTAAVRSGQEVREGAVDVIAVLVARSLPGLGLVDLGEVEAGPVLRLSQQARRWLEPGPGAFASASDAGESSRSDRPAAFWATEHRLRCGLESETGSVVETARYGRMWLEPQAVGIEIDEATLAFAADHDPDLAGLRAGLLALTAAPIPAAVEALMARASAQKPMCALLRTSAFVEIEDPQLRKAVYGDPEGKSVWAGPPLSEGLLVKPGVSLTRVQDLLTRHGARLYPE